MDAHPPGRRRPPQAQRTLNFGCNAETRRYSYRLGDRLGQAGDVQYGHDKGGFRNLRLVGDEETRYVYEPSGLLLAVALPMGGAEAGEEAAGCRARR